MKKVKEVKNWMEVIQLQPITPYQTMEEGEW